MKNVGHLLLLLLLPIIVFAADFTAQGLNNEMTTEEDLTVATVADFHDDPKATGKSAHETETPELDDEGQSSKLGEKMGSSLLAWTPQYTTFRGTAAIGSQCTTSCSTASPPAPAPLGFTISSVGWCSVAEKDATGAYLWGECGGCPSGKYKTGGSPGGSSSSTGCTGTCHTSCRSCEDAPANDIGRHCTSCKPVVEGWMPFVAQYVGPQNLIHQCNNNLLGTRHKMECRPFQVLTANSDGKYNCVKSGTINAGVKPLSSTTASWWAVSCAMVKYVRCTDEGRGTITGSGTQRGTCYATKTVTCLKACDSSSYAAFTDADVENVLNGGPSQSLSTLEQNNFNNRGDSSLNSGSSYSYTLQNGYPVTLSGWTHTREYAKGFLRAVDGHAKAVVSGLTAGADYQYRVYQASELYTDNLVRIYWCGGVHKLQVNTGSWIDTVANSGDEPTAKGSATADSAGKITFTIDRQPFGGQLSKHATLSGLAIGKIEPSTASTCYTNCEDNGGKINNIDKSKWCQEQASGY